MESLNLTNWMSLCAILVIFMTTPGLALFYGGLVRHKNVLSILTQCYAIAAMMTLLWVFIGYTLVFTSSAHFNAFIGGWKDFFLLHLTTELQQPSSPHLNISYFLYEMGFAIITPALIIGGFAERMKFSAILWFMLFWEIFVYYPIAHCVWGGGWLQHLGILDFAGGTVVHINAGVAGLVAAIMLGKRLDFNEKKPMPPNNINLIAIGTGILWFGWFGFNSGSATTFLNIQLALLNTQLAATAASIVWMFCEWLYTGRPTAISICVGVIIGLVAVTPAAGYIGPQGAIVIGILSSLICWPFTILKNHLGYDDALDAFAIHGFGGIVGSLLTAIFAAQIFGGLGLPKGISVMHQLGIQLIGIVAVIAWSAIVTFIILFVIEKIMGLRIKKESEEIGIDRVMHAPIGS